MEEASMTIGKRSERLKPSRNFDPAARKNNPATSVHRKKSHNENYDTLVLGLR